MNYFKLINEKIEELIELGEKKFVIYPFGEKGAIAKSVLETCYKIYDVKVYDNLLADQCETICPLHEISSISADTLVLIASDNIEIYELLREKLFKYVSKERCVELLPVPKKILEKRRSVLARKRLIEGLQKGIDEHINVYHPKKTNSKFFLPLYASDFIQSRLFLSDDYFERKILDKISNYKSGIIKKHVMDGEAILDIGANIGNHTLFYCNEMGATNVYAFEPLLPTYMILKENIRINNLNDKVKLYNYALGEQSGRAIEHIYNLENIGGTAINSNEDGDIQLIAFDEIEIKEKVCFMKIDVEGFEFNVLKGARRFFEKMHPIIHIEIMKDNYERVNNLLNEYGYTCAMKLGASDFLYEYS